MPAGPPVVPGVVHGLREWTCSSRRRRPRLAAKVHNAAWPPHGAALKAHCLHHDHPAPASACDCGIYAWHPSEAHAAFVFPPADWRGSVTGVVEAWGALDVHADGFRAEHARARWLVQPATADAATADHLRALAEEYDAEVLVVHGAADLAAHCRDHGLGLEPAAVTRLLGHAPARNVRRAGQALRRGGWAGAREAVVEAALGAGAFVVGALLWIGLPAAAIFGYFSSDVSPLTRADRALRIVEQVVVPVTDGALYAAVVRNTSRTRTALDVAPVGEFRDRSGRGIGEPDAVEDLWAAPSIPPGETAVVIDWLDGRPALARATRRFGIRMHADGGFRRTAPPPASVTRVRADLRRCVVVGTVRSRRQLRQVDVVLVARDRRGRIAWVRSDGVAGPVPRGRSRQILERIMPAGCRRSVRTVEAHPWWAPDELRFARSRPRRG